MTMSAARSRSMPLWLRRAWYSAANRSRSSVVERAQQPGVGEVDAQHRGPSLPPARVAQDREVGDLAAQQDVGGQEDPVVVALGEHDVAPVGDGEVEQLVLEHQRRHGLAAGDLEPVEQRVAVDVLVEQRQGRGDLAGRVLVRADPGPTSRAVAVSLVPRSVAMIGIVAPSPSISRLTWAAAGSRR